MKWTSFLIGIRRIAVLQRFNTIMNMLKIMVFLIVLFVDPRVINFMTVLLALAMVNFFYFRSRVLQWFKANEITRHPRFFDKAIFDSMWSATWRMGISQWGYFFSKYGTDLIIAQMKNAPLIAGYLFTKKILQFIRRLSEASVNAHLPEHYSKMAVKKYKEVKEKLSADMFLNTFMQIAGYTAFGILSVPLFDALGIDKELVPLFVFIIMSLTELFDSFSWVHGTVYVSTNHVPFMIPTVINGALIVLMSYLSLGTWGIQGVILSKFIIQLAFINWFAPYLNLNLLNWKFSQHMKDISILGGKLWFFKIKAVISKL
jgi:hypothetical protein